MVRVNAPVRLEKAPPGLGLKQGISLDFRIAGVNPRTHAPMLLKPWVGIEGGGMRRLPGRPSAFATFVRVGLRDSLDPNDPRPLAPAVRLYLAATVDSLAPPDLSIDSTNRYDYRARVATLVDADTVRLELWGSDAVKTVIAIPFVHPALALDADRTRVPGFGLGVATLHVTIPAGAVPEGDSVPVSVRSTRGGTLERSVVYARGGGTAELRVRSGGIAHDSIIARAPGLMAAGTGIDYAFPTAFLVATLVGALLGGLMSFLQGRKKPLRVLPRALLVGLPSGILLAIAVGALGIKLQGFAPDLPGGEALVLFVAALGAFGGAKGLGKLVAPFGR
jgi:hypothetical protein